MGVNTFKLKLLAYAMGALFAGLAGAFFCARMRLSARKASPSWNRPWC
jgi:ABC-type branched-subunit amino acid transport system permease subunit